LLSVAVISVTVVDNVSSDESFAYIDTLVCLKASGMALVKTEKSNRPRQLPWGIPDSTWIMLEASIKEHPLCSVRQVTLYPQYHRESKAITQVFLISRLMIENVKKSNKTALKLFNDQFHLANQSRL
jgi:hypothetical protein